MLFQTAGIEVSPWGPPLVAFVISFFTSMGGVSGAFLLLPFQMSFLGYVNPSVSATNQFFNIVATPSGVYRYFREKRMVWPLVRVVAAGTLPGVFIGAVVRVLYLPDPKNFKLFAGCLLFCIGLKMVCELLSARGGGKDKPEGKGRVQEEGRDDRINLIRTEAVSSSALSEVGETFFNFKRLGYTYNGERFDVSFRVAFTLCFIVGIVGGIYGIGGGAIIAPFLVTFFGLPVHTVAGAALMGTFITSVAGVAFYQIIAPFFPGMSVAPDWTLGFLFGIGGMAGMYLGARCQKYVPAQAIKWMLAGIILLTALKYAAAFLG